jgi:hemerythrin
MQSALASHCAAPATGVLVMDVLHRKVDDALDAALGADDATFLQRFCRLVTVLEEAFATEEFWMEEIDYPAIRSHREQHARVLSGMHHVYCSLLAGDAATARKVVTFLLPDFLKLHGETMDTALSMHLQVSGMPVLEAPLSLSARQLLARTEFRQ